MLVESRFLKRNFFSGILGNIFLHYDNALFALLAPFIAPLFFPKHSAISALILTYGMMILGIVSKPIGSLFFGYVGDRFGRKRALFFTLIGMAGVTCLMGFVPTYQQVGKWAPFLLAFCRFLQSFFAAGEAAGGAMIILEKAPEKRRSFFNSLYDASSLIGMFLASLAVTLFSRQEETLASFWRIPFFLGSLCGVCAIFVRLFTTESLEKIAYLSVKEHLKLVYKLRSLLLPLIFASGFAYTTYTYAFTLMNGFLPFVSSISKQQACSMNTYLLVLDCLLLPVFGLLSQRFSKEKIMSGSAWLSVALAIPLFSLLGDASEQTAIFVRIVILTLGVGFSATYYHWALEKVPADLRYTVIATATAIGSRLIGVPSAAVSLWLYHKTGWVVAPALYLIVAASCAGVVVSPLFGNYFKAVKRP